MTETKGIKKFAVILFFVFRKRFFSSHCELAKSTKSLAVKEKQLVMDSMTQVLNVMSKAHEMKNRHLSMKMAEAYRTQIK